MFSFVDREMCYDKTIKCLEDFMVGLFRFGDFFQC